MKTRAILLNFSEVDNCTVCDVFCSDPEAAQLPTGSFRRAASVPEVDAEVREVGATGY